MTRHVTFVIVFALALPFVQDTRYDVVIRNARVMGQPVGARGRGGEERANCRGGKLGAVATIRTIGASVVSFNVSPHDIDAIMREPSTMSSSDADWSRRAKESRTPATTARSRAS